MMRWIVESGLRLRFLVVILAAVLMVAGVAQLRAMPVDVYPEFDPPLVEVQTEALGLSASEMEALITVPLEADLLNGVAWLDQIYSESVAGLSSILLVFEPGTDPIRARQMVQERLTQTFALPNVSQPPTMLQPLSTSSRVMMVGLTSDELSLMEMGVLARWNVKPRLMGVPGVANVAIWGHRDRQLQVQVDPRQLQSAGVTLDQIIKTTGEALWVSPLSYLESSSPGTAGWIDTPNQRLTIRHEMPISSADDLAEVAIVGHDDLLLGDVAHVIEDHQPLIGDALLGESSGLLLVVEKFPGANTLEVTRGVEEALHALAPGLEGIEIDSTVFRPANYIEAAIGNLSTGALIAGLLVILVLGAFFFDWRTALISLVAIPLSLVAAVFVLSLRGDTFNAMVLTGLIIALGVVIDNAVGVVDNIALRLRQSPEGAPVAHVVLQAALESRRSLNFALLIILLAAAPLFFLPGLTGAFLRPLAISYVLALLTSLLVTLVVTPALAVLLLGDSSRERRPSPLQRRLQRWYDALLARTMGNPSLAVVLVAAIVLLALAVLPLFNVSLVPSFKQTNLLIEWKAAPGTSHLALQRTMALAAQELRAIPGVRNAGALLGRAITGDAIVGTNSGQLAVSLDPHADYEATLAQVHEVLDGYPGLSLDAHTYQPERTMEALLGAERDLIVRIYGHDLPLLHDKAAEVRETLAGIEGVEEITADRLVEEPQVEIEVDLAAAERYQIKPGDVRRQATTLLSGLRVGNLYEENKVFDVVVWGVPELRDSLTDISTLLIDTPRGQIPLQELADVRVVPSPTVIKRDVVSRYVDVRVIAANVAAVAPDVERRLQTIEFPLEFHAEVLGVSAEALAAQQRIRLMVIAVLIGVFLLLQASFESWRLAAMTMLALPMALAGGVLAALAGGAVFTLGALFGFYAILGVAVRHLVVLINHFQHLEQDEGEAFGRELVLRGARERAAPVLITTLATGLALAPLIVGGDIAGFEILRAMAIVIVGGLITSMVLALFVMPTLYLRFGPSRAPEPEEPAGQLTPDLGTTD